MEMKATLAVLLILELYGLSSALVKQHHFVNEKKTWDDARSHCRAVYHELSSFADDSEEQQFMDYADHESDNAWIGLHKVSGVWKWSGGENATQIRWATGQPDEDGSNDNCGFLYNNAEKLHYRKCSETHPFFCMIRSALMPQTETWEGALEYCRKYHHDLATLNSETRMNAALQVISPAQTEFVWTGLRFLAGRWFWVAGGNLNNTAWSVTGQPECPTSNLRCGALRSQTKAWTIKDCEEKLSFICQ